MGCNTSELKRALMIPDAKADQIYVRRAERENGRTPAHRRYSHDREKGSHDGEKEE